MYCLLYKFVILFLYWLIESSVKRCSPDDMMMMCGGHYGDCDNDDDSNYDVIDVLYVLCNFSCIDEWFAVNRTCPEHPGDWSSFLCHVWKPLTVWVLFRAAVQGGCRWTEHSYQLWSWYRLTYGRALWWCRSHALCVCVSVLLTDARVGFVLSLACGVLVPMTMCTFA